MINCWVVDVTAATHDDLKCGVVERTWGRVFIAAEEVASDQEAVLLAAQIATGHGMCTSARLVSWPDSGDPRKRP